MSDLIVKDNALMNASYNLDLVEQRLSRSRNQLDQEEILQLFQQRISTE